MRARPLDTHASSLSRDDEIIDKALSLHESRKRLEKALAAVNKGQRGGSVSDAFVKVVGAAVVVVVVVAFLALLMGYPTMWIVNYLFASSFLVKVFGVAKLTFWRAFWLNWLAGTLFKSTVTSK